MKNQLFHFLKLIKDLSRYRKRPACGLMQKPDLILCTITHALTLPNNSIIIIIITSASSTRLLFGEAYRLTALLLVAGL
jgi:hypothetical protein